MKTLSAIIAATAIALAIPHAARAETPDARGCAAGFYKLCRDNSDLMVNWEYQGTWGMPVTFICLREAAHMRHKELPPYTFGDIRTQLAMKGRDFIDTGIVKLTNHGMKLANSKQGPPRQGVHGSIPESRAFLRMQTRRGFCASST